MRKAIFLLTFTMVLALAVGNAWAGSVTNLHTFSSGTPAYADSINENFQLIEAAVNDNDTRISTTGRVFLAANDGSGQLSMVGGESTTYRFRTTVPDDYVSQGSGDVTYSAVFIGGDNCNIRILLNTGGLSFGTNGGLVIVPPAATHSIPNIDSGSPSFEAYLSNPSKTRTGFSDVTWFSFARYGGDALDTCAGSMNFYGILVEYPRGP